MPPSAHPAPRAIVVVCPAGASPDHPVVLPAHEPVVTCTAFLEWNDAAAVGVGAGSARKQLSTSQAIRAFGRRLRFSQVPAQRLLNYPGLLDIAFTGAAWSQYLGELIASGLLSATFNSLHTLEMAIDGLVITSMANLTVIATDLQLGEPTAAPVTATAVGRRRHAGVAAAPAGANYAALHHQLEFLDAAHLSLESLEERHAVAPWARISFLCGALGPCLTQMERNAAGSTARLTASALANGLARTFDSSLDDPSALAGDLPGFISQLRTRLPPIFRCQSVETAGLRLELRDSILYGRDHVSRAFVEKSRLMLVKDTYPSLKAFILDLSSSSEEAYCACNKARASLLQGGSSSTETALAHCLPDLERCLGAQLALLQPIAARPGATATSVITNLVDALSSIRHNVPSAVDSSAGNSRAHGGHSDGSAVVAGPAHRDAVEAAICSRAGQKFVSDFSVCDTTTAEGCLAAVATGFSRDCILTVRLLCHGDRNVARRCPELGGLLALRPYLPDYFTRCLTTDASTGRVPFHLLGWSLSETSSRVRFFQQFLRQDFVLMDWAGVGLELHNARHLLPTSPLPVADHYCIPEVISMIIELGESLFLGMDIPTAPALPAGAQSGFTWRSWWTFFVGHLRFGANHLPSCASMLNWLDEAHAQALEALRLMSTLLHAQLTSTEPAAQCLGVLLPYDCQPAVVLRRGQQNITQVRKSHHLACLFAGGEIVVHDGWNSDPGGRYFGDVWPLRLERHGTATPAPAAGLKRPTSTADGDGAVKPAINRGNLKRIRKLHPPIKGRGPCYYHFQPGERCPNGALCPFHHGF